MCVIVVIVLMIVCGVLKFMFVIYSGVGLLCDVNWFYFCDIVCFCDDCVLCVVYGSVGVLFVVCGVMCCVMLCVDVL